MVLSSNEAHGAGTFLLIHALPAYLLGSIPFGYLFGRLKGVDLREHGSGNIGATNALRVLGKGMGIATFVLDFLKAPIAYGIVGWFSAHPMVLPIILFSVLGHNYPVWLKFKGGKGISTSAGGLLIWMPDVFLTVLMIWMIVFAIFRMVSLASLACAMALPLAAWFFHGNEKKWILICCILAAMAFWRHRENIRRLMAGTEHRWVKNREQGIGNREQKTEGKTF